MGNSNSSGNNSTASTGLDTARREAPAENAQTPLFTFGIAADVQYAGTGPQISRAINVTDLKTFIYVTKNNIF